MSGKRGFIGGQANWAGAAFELRLGVEFCVMILMGEDAGLAPGRARHVQLQAPEAVDDVIMVFETGTRWAIQAKAGRSVRLSWHREGRFGRALRQLYAGAIGGAYSDSPASTSQRIVSLLRCFKRKPSWRACLRI